MNKILIIGNLTHDPELRSTDSGVPVCSFTVAVNRRRGGAEAGKQDTDYMRISAWRNLGEMCKRYLRKGSRVLVVGEIEEANAYLTRDGEPAATLEVTGRMVKFLGGDGAQGEDNAEETPFAMAGAEIPF